MSEEKKTREELVEEIKPLLVQSDKDDEMKLREILIAILEDTNASLTALADAVGVLDSLVEGLKERLDGVEERAAALYAKSSVKMNPPKEKEKKDDHSSVDKEASKD